IFQYKIIYNILPTQASLFRSNLTENGVCSLCNLENSRNLTCCFHALCLRLCGISSHAGGRDITLTETIILHGWHQERGSNTWIALNYSIIIAKYHIFSTSVRGSILDFENFLFRLKDKISTLQAIATKNIKLDKFKATWSPLL
ncbi:hypothetical protein ACROYT_G009167, partial [Oculina patagonica]